MANQTDRTPTCVLVAIDIAKRWNAALIEYPDGKRQRFQFQHAREDYDRLVKLLQSTGSSCRIAFEPTGVYHRTLAYQLLQEGFQVRLVRRLQAPAIATRCSTAGTRTTPRMRK